MKPIRATNFNATQQRAITHVANKITTIHIQVHTLFIAEKPCGAREKQFENESCYEFLDADEAPTLEYEESLSYCEAGGYRLPHIGSESELIFFNELV